MLLGIAEKCASESGLRFAIKVSVLVIHES